MNETAGIKESIVQTAPTARIWEIYPELVIAIKKSHDAYDLKGHHDIYHALRVGDIAYRIAYETWDCVQTPRLSGIAGLCHNADRILSASDATPSDEDVSRLIHLWLGETSLNWADRKIVVSAVLAHDQKNDPRDSNVLVALKDADRIVNLDLDVLMRAGQFRPTLPTVDYAHFIDSPTASFKNPESVIRSMAYVLEWTDPTTDVCIRTEAGLAMARTRSERIRNYLNDLKKQLQSEGVFPAPF